MEFCFEVNPDLDLAIGSELFGRKVADDFHNNERVVDVIPLDATGAKPGSETKVQMLAARYAAGVPLWHGSSDSYRKIPLILRLAGGVAGVLASYLHSPIAPMHVHHINGQL